MPTELISPNLHVALIHYPLAFLFAGTLIELFSFLWPRGGFRAAGRWMVLLGALSSVVAVYSGIYALRDVARVDTGDAKWVDIRATSAVLSQPDVWRLLRTHLLYQSVATGICAAVVVFWLGSSDRARRAFHIPLLLALLCGVGLTGLGAWYGGEAIYRHGVAVEKMFPKDATIAPAPTRIEARFPPIELHVVMAGVATAFALGSVGLSFRKLTATYQLADTRPIRPTGQTMAPNAQRIPPTEVAMARSFNPDIEMEVRPFAPAGRFWLLTTLIALTTVAGGLFVLGRSSDVVENARDKAGHVKYQQIPRLLWDQIKPTDHKLNRAFSHSVAGTTIVVLPLALAGLSRFAPRRRIVLGFFTTLLIAAIGSQIWLGILLLYDTGDGPVTRFNTAASVK